MYKALLLGIFFSNFAQAQSPRTQQWEYAGEGSRPVIRKVTDSSQIFIPFVNITAPVALFDTLIAQSQTHDSLLSLCETGCQDCLPRPVVAAPKGKAMLYLKTTTVEKSNFPYKIYSFYISETAEFQEHDCILFYYVPHVGVVAAFHHILDDWHIFRNYDRYLLTKTSEKTKATLKHNLSQVMDEVMKECACPL